MATGRQYTALLRGINVGGSNIIRMGDLKACFEGVGFGDVATYIQSGNVLFASPERDTAALRTAIERALLKAFGLPVLACVLPHAGLSRVVTRAPPGFGAAPALYRYDVIFVMSPLTPGKVLREVRLREGVDAAATGPGVLYFSRLAARASQSHLSKLAALPLYRQVTARNWNTTTRLLALMDARALHP